jgi:hypothetical protein
LPPRTGALDVGVAIAIRSSYAIASRNDWQI